MALGGLACAVLVSHAAELQIAFPQARDAFQTNEAIDVSVVRSSSQALAAGSLQLKLSGADGSSLAFAFPLDSVNLKGDAARSTEHLHLNGWLLRPGTYKLEVAADGATVEAKIEVHSHVRHSDFMTINWTNSTAGGQIVQGEDSLGYNLMYMAGAQENANFIRAGVDYMRNCSAASPGT